jgi:hypothetical protein
MQWRERPRLAGFLIWVADVRGHWIASVAALPRTGGAYTAGPGEHVIPGEFSTLEAAEDAAQKYVNEQQERKP